MLPEDLTKAILAKPESDEDWWRGIEKCHVKMCSECKKRPVYIDYNGHGYWVCKVCYDRLSDAFDEDYR